MCGYHGDGPLRNVIKIDLNNQIMASMAYREEEKKGIVLFDIFRHFCTFQDINWHILNILNACSWKVWNTQFCCS